MKKASAIAWRVEQSAAALYLAWIAIAALAHALAAAPLAAGAGLVLGIGAVFTIALFLGIARLPLPEQPPATVLAAAQAVMGIGWASLYTWFAGHGLAAALLAAGMSASAVALAVPVVSGPVLARLMLAALLASVAVAGSPLAGLALAALLAALYLPARHLAAVRARLEADNAELSTGIERIRRSAERDQLTSSYSRQFILEMVAREKSRADRSGEPLCLCLLDIDHFKDMNDRYGHLAGDRILAAFARRVRGALRTMDTVNGAGVPEEIGRGDRNSAAGALGRVGGEEFIVLLPETSLRGALRCAERVRKAVVRRPFEGLHQVTVSIGIAEYRMGETVSSLIGRADEALYGAKHAGRNRVHCATTDGPNAIVMPDIPAAG